MTCLFDIKPKSVYYEGKCSKSDLICLQKNCDVISDLPFPPKSIRLSSSWSCSASGAADDFRPYPVMGRVDPAELLPPFLRDPDVSGLDSGSSS
jgi:hypothetical protein